MSDAQLAWLDAQLTDAAAAGDRVVVAVHQPLHEDTAPPVCLLWNYDDVRRVLAKHAATCAAVLAGHAHRDGAAVCADGVLHRTFAAVLEAKPGTDCFATLELHDDRVVINGRGVESGEVVLRGK